MASGGSVAKNAAALNGSSSAGNGVQGISGKNSASGVYGQNNSTGFGVAGRSPNGTGIMGDSSGGWAVQAFGNASQTRAGNGFAKAMAEVIPFDNTSDHVQKCFNSQLPPSQATIGDCGITFTKLGTGFYRLTFNFRVNDRIVLATARGDDALGTANSGAGETSLTVSSNNLGGAADDTTFHIVVF